MESITSPTTNNQQPFVTIPSEVGAGGYLRVSGDPGVLQDLQQEYHAVETLPKRAIQGMANFIGNVASNVALEAKVATFDAIHGTNYRVVRHELIEQQRRERFERSIGLIAIKR